MIITPLHVAALIVVLLAVMHYDRIARFFGFYPRRPLAVPPVSNQAAPYSPDFDEAIRIAVEAAEDEAKARQRSELCRQLRDIAIAASTPIQSFGVGKAIPHPAYTLGQPPADSPK